MTAELDVASLETILKGVMIPSPPQIVVDLQMEMMGPDPDINEIAKLISRDAGLSGGVLKAVNASAFGLGRTVSSIHEAVVLLGLEAVNCIFNTLCLRSELKLKNSTKEAEELLNLFWDVSADVAQVAALIAKRCGCVKPEKAYILGLFHNSGMVLLTHRFKDYPKIIGESYSIVGDRVVDIENRHLGTNHAVIGYYIAKSWKLASEYGQAIALHHSVVSIFTDSSKEDVPEEVKNLLAILKMAEHVVGVFRVVGGQMSDHEWDAIAVAVNEHLGMSDDDVEDVISMAREMAIGGQDYYT